MQKYYHGIYLQISDGQEVFSQKAFGLGLHIFLKENGNRKGEDELHTFCIICNLCIILVYTLEFFGMANEYNFHL